MKDYKLTEKEGVGQHFLKNAVTNFSEAAVLRWELSGIVRKYMPVMEPINANFLTPFR
jgi:hypothetical protein